MRNMKANLKDYNVKRNFLKTSEPSGALNDNVSKLKKNTEDKIKKTAKSQKKLRFVVQHHLATRDHYDFRIEWKGVMLSWAVPKGPSFNPKDKRLAVEVEPHPLEYRNFEGTIPKGEYGGGTVMLWDEGYYEPVGNFDKSYNEGALKFILEGKRLFGSWTLVKIKNKEEKETQSNWLLLKEKDEFTLIDNGITSYNTSIRTDRTMEEIASGKEKQQHKAPFSTAEVQLAKLSSVIPKGKEWIYEIKYDGYRIVSYIDSNRVKLFSRNGNDYSKNFSDIASSLQSFFKGRQVVLDGEIAVIDENGKTDFSSLQNYVKNKTNKNLCYIVFDVLALDGEDIREKPLSYRKQKLKSILGKAPDNIILGSYMTKNGEQFFKAVSGLGLEGIVCKNLKSKYTSGKNNDWVKVKCDNRQEFIICGYTLTDKKSSGISSLILGAYSADEVIYVGRVGTGFTEKLSQDMQNKLDKIKIDKSMFKVVPKISAKEKIVWTKLKYIAEIKFAEWTSENLLRQASFKGLREDKETKDVVIEKDILQENNLEINKETKQKKLSKSTKKADVNISEKMIKNPEDNKKTILKDKAEKKEVKDKNFIIKGVKVSSPDKIIFKDPMVNKLEVVEYYSIVCDYMFRFAGNRILSLVRCPKGTEGECFFKKHPGPDTKGIVPINIEKDKEYFYIADSLGFIKEAQMGTLEFHTWGSKIDSYDTPDTMVFDLDPDEGMPLKDVRQGVKDLKGVLDSLSLQSFVKTSGGKGYHVVVPFKPSCNWEKFSDFSKKVAEIMETKWPDKYTSNMRKEKRKGKIFIDWVRNGKGATSVAPFSLRARDGAKVSMPIFWNELDKIAPDDIDIDIAITRLKGKDPWKDFYKISQSLV